MKNKVTTVVCNDIEGNEYTVSASELTFRPAVYGVIIKEEKILLAKQWNGYDFPGGGIELGEHIEDALVREVKEETGIDVKPIKILYSNSSFFKLPFDDKYVQSIHLYYLCEPAGGELTTEFFDTNEVKYADHPEWVDLDTIPKLKLYSSTDPQKILAGLL